MLYNIHNIEKKVINMLQQLVNYIDSNFGKVENVFLNDDHTLGIEMRYSQLSNIQIEKIMDNNTFLEGISHEYENTFLFNISPLDEGQISSEVFDLVL